MAKDTKSTIMVAVISAISAIVIALITTFGTIAVSAPKVNEVKEDLQNIDNIQLIKNLPIGTILASMLKSTEFAKAVGDPNRTKNNWVLADGQKDITTSRYGQLSGKTTPPDLRGMFLRGMNVNGGQDPQQGREVGSLQMDAFKSHTHNYPTAGQTSRNWRGSQSSDYHLAYNSPGTVDPNGGLETRPKNVAVYFYIKIN